jgi:hypothetical protein
MVEDEQDLNGVKKIVHQYSKVSFLIYKVIIGFGLRPTCICIGCIYFNQRSSINI